MEVRNSANPADVKRYDTEALRGEFLIRGLFAPDEIPLVYSHVDRMITGSACPVSKSLSLKGGKELGVDFFLQRREMAVLNIGDPGTVVTDGTSRRLNRYEALYIGMGTKDVSFEPETGSTPKFYLLSCPAHSAWPTTLITREMAVKQALGTKKECNERVINKYVHPDVVKSCQLSMGMTELAEGSVWNTMPTHTHERRMEVYMYFNLPEDGVVFHFMGRPSELRHIVVRSGEAVISPSWSIHSGVGSTSYSFVWGMAGENQSFSDMDGVPMSVLR
ncbi:4-deoxy-L-threo-5-hexulose uronate isomerase [Aminivibrio pyruvatiphilus]|uniref:4-deoxy-L-threo-5-hexosulose-uronate ketol-isomerase n=1 Tax=Aminivibrio pyruvatiphilus TaxID=1005740 RepID=A0A4R8MBV5_9BACT|nr:5-dehydro-4-deoxy-D-glucuronate isomerase [Aminivibrio pyruvatiphilus]TDY63213.1 4-deoxy-L-threo-5-hexulose uronate isomerase [Aminivibrio pyruvatiphilus]